MKNVKKDNFKIGDLVSHRHERPSLFGVVVKVYETKANTNEYSVSWLQHGRSRCTEGILEMVSAG
jgi:hypothetical protein